MPLTVTTLPVKKCSGNDRSHFQNTNINIKISAENGQSASGGHFQSSASKSCRCEKTVQHSTFLTSGSYFTQISPVGLCYLYK